MDNSASLLPGRNPAGMFGIGNEGAIPNIGSTSGANPMLPPPNLPASAPVANPFDTSTVPTFGANQGGVTSSLNLGTPGAPAGTNPVTGVTTPRQQGRTLGELQDMYGEGLGALMYQFLQGGAGFNQQAVNNLLASLQPGVNRGTESLMDQFSTSGNRFGSGAQIGLADYLSQVNLNEGQIVSQMYEQAVNNYMSVLTGASAQSLQKKETSGSIWDTIGEIAGIAAAPFTGGASLALTGALAASKGGMKTSGSFSLPPFSAPSGPTQLAGDIPGEPTGNLPTTFNTNTLSILDQIASLTGGGGVSSSIPDMVPIVPPSI